MFKSKASRVRPCDILRLPGCALAFYLSRASLSIHDMNNAADANQMADPRAVPKASPLGKPIIRMALFAATNRPLDKIALEECALSVLHSGGLTAGTD